MQGRRGQLFLMATRGKKKNINAIQLLFLVYIEHAKSLIMPFYLPDLQSPAIILFPIELGEQSILTGLQIPSKGSMFLNYKYLLLIKRRPNVLIYFLNKPQDFEIDNSGGPELEQSIWYIICEYAICVGKGNGNPLQYSCLEIPGTEAPSGLLSVGLYRVGHD